EIGGAHGSMLSSYWWIRAPGRSSPGAAHAQAGQPEGSAVLAGLEHDLADMPAAVDQLMGAVGLVQREGLMDERLELAGPYQRPDLRFQFADDLRLVVGAARTQGKAGVGEALGQHREEVEFPGRARGHADPPAAAGHCS